MDFDFYLKNRVERIERYLAKCLSLETATHLPPLETDSLVQAIRYSVLNGGKRLRPLLVYLTGEALGTPLKQLDAPAAAVELIHCYSLIHDDLPAMDDDDLRRGKPSCHKAFDEATAILAGDALQTLAFQILSDSELNIVPAAQQIQMINILAKKSGLTGMVGGQALDLAAEGRGPTFSIEALCQIHHQKTGALIEASVLLGALAAELSTPPDLLLALQTYATAIGLSFQVQDDILDVEGETALLGKTAGKDQQQLKATFPQLLGLTEAKEYARNLHQQALNAINCLNEKGLYLAKLSELFINRLN
jgi:geranylgeranyl pyrophosphate synthase